MHRIVMIVCTHCETYLSVRLILVIESQIVPAVFSALFCFPSLPVSRILKLLAAIIEVSG